MEYPALLTRTPVAMIRVTSTIAPTAEPWRFESVSDLRSDHPAQECFALRIVSDVRDLHHEVHGGLDGTEGHEAVDRGRREHLAGQVTRLRELRLVADLDVV